jgi:hypothetical protein
MRIYNLLKQNKILTVSIALVILILATAAIHKANKDQPSNMKPIGNLEKNAEIKLSQKADLFGSGNEATIALINLPSIPEQDYRGYVGIWDNKNKLIQKIEVKGYDIQFPVQIKALDITGDKKSDIILETDVHANGGLGAHALHVYVQEKGHFVETTVPFWLNTSFSVTLNNFSNVFTINSVENRNWTAQWTAEQLKNLDSNTPIQQSPVNIDPISSINLQNNILTTKSLIWFGNLQLNSLAILVTSYHWVEGTWAVKSYNLESVDKMSIVTEQNLINK